MKMTDSPLANAIRILEPHFIVHLCGRQDLRKKDTWKSTPTQMDGYVTQGCLWLGHMQSERGPFPPKDCCLCHDSHHYVSINLL